MRPLRKLSRKLTRDIKVFIGSSAELNEDKQVFADYFSGKNKIYHDRGIYFDQRTWMDFSSSLNEGRLQDRYNAYIRNCDIAIFLFHTRLGQYTKEELETAYGCFLKSRSTRPRIFVFFKEDGIEDDSLKDFKSYCENRLGHFCDVYTSHDDLIAKFDRQLQILENERFITPYSSSIRLLYTIEFTLIYIIAPIIVAVLAFFAVHYYTPGTATVRLDDLTPSTLPFRGADVTLQYSDKSETLHLDKLTDEVLFKEIHSKHMGGDARLTISAEGYVTVDTVVRLSKSMTVGIRRDQSSALVFGTVKDEDNRPLEGVTIQVLDLETTTDHAGNFRLAIPTEKQKEEQRVTAYKEGYQLWDFTSPVSDKIPWKIILKRQGI